MLSYSFFAVITAMTVPVSATTVRVKVVPELGGVRGVPLMPAGPVIGPLTLASNALTPSLALLAPSIQPAAPAVLTPMTAAAQPAPLRVRPETLIKTLSSPLLDTTKMSSGQAAAAADNDFMARAQLGSANALTRGVTSVPSAAQTPNETRPALTKPAGNIEDKSYASPSGDALDATGSLMKEALLKAAQARGAAITLGFIPTPKSLKVLAEARKEFMLYRRRADGAWLMHGGGETMSVENSDEDYDIGLHNHPMFPGLSAYTARYPTPEDFHAATGLDARVAVVAQQGIVEWNPILPNSFWGRLTATAFGRAAVGVFMPYFYEGHVKRLGLAVNDLSWRRVTQDWLERGKPPLSAELVVDHVIPEIVAAELPLIASKLGVELTPAHKADVLARTSGYRLYRHSAVTDREHRNMPESRFSPDVGIRLMVKPGWKKIPDLAAHYGPLFAREYAHWLQNSGFISVKYGAESAASAVGILRAVELGGLEAVKSEELSVFEAGRAWARAGFATEEISHLPGAFAGAAYEAAEATGRPDAAWEFLRLVIAGQNAVDPATAWRRVVK